MRSARPKLRSWPPGGRSCARPRGRLPRSSPMNSRGRPVRCSSWPGRATTAATPSMPPPTSPARARGWTSCSPVIVSTATRWTRRSRRGPGCETRPTSAAPTPTTFSSSTASWASVPPRTRGCGGPPVLSSRRSCRWWPRSGCGWWPWTSRAACTPTPAKRMPRSSPPRPPSPSVRSRRASCVGTARDSRAASCSSTSDSNRSCGAGRAPRAGAVGVTPRVAQRAYRSTNARRMPPVAVTGARRTAASVRSSSSAAKYPYDA